MVNAKLHMICGNCGCNDEFEYEIVFDEIGHEQYERSVWIWCRNCTTVHVLGNNAKAKSEQLKKGE